MTVGDAVPRFILALQVVVARTKERKRLIWFKRKRHLREAFLEITYVDKPGSFHPSLDDLRAEAVEFERSVFDYLRATEGEPKATGRETLNAAIKFRLRKADRYPEMPELWSKFVDELDQLRRYRNSLVHSDFTDLPPVPELYRLFKSANERLLPFRFYRLQFDRFSEPQWVGNLISLTIDGDAYLLNPSEVSNLLLELHPASRGKQNYIKGRPIEAKVMGYETNTHTYFIGEEPPFDLDLDEAASLGELLDSWIYRECYAR